MTKRVPKHGDKVSVEHQEFRGGRRICSVVEAIPSRNFYTVVLGTCAHTTLVDQDQYVVTRGQIRFLKKKKNFGASIPTYLGLAFAGKTFECVLGERAVIFFMTATSWDSLSESEKEKYK